ncbi:MAG: NUDIX domain-containing protein [Candidatus Pacearchaeota archaeon]
MKRLRKGVFVVVFSLKPLRYLLLRRKLHWKGWEFPKGGVIAREKIENTVRREVQEETGLKVLNIIPFKSKGEFTYDKKTQRERKAKGFSYILFGCEVKKGRVKISKKEHDNFKWLSYAKAVKLLRWPNQKKAIRIVNDALKKV